MADDANASGAGFDPVPGQAERVAPLVRRILAPNPSVMTYRGTNTYLVGEGALTVVDPGPADRAHLAAILAALAPGERIARILVTHSHLDHSALVPALKEATGAPVLAFGDSSAGRSPLMERVAASGLVGGGEGRDEGFMPDEILADGAVVEDDGWQIEALHTPGHFSNHMSFRLGGTIFTGDQVMGWATSIISPPDGDLGAYMASLARLEGAGAELFLPGHGAPVRDPAGLVGRLARHRREREDQILSVLEAGGATAGDLTRRIYAGLPVRLLPMAERNVLAHLLDLHERGRVTAHPEPAAFAVFALR